MIYKAGSTSLRIAAVGLAVTSIAGLGSAKTAQPQLIPGKSAYVVSIPDTAGLATAVKSNSLYKLIEKEVSPLVEAKMSEEQVAEKLKSIEGVLGFALTADNFTKIYKSVDFYVVPGQSKDDVAIGIIIGVGDKDKAAQLLKLGELAAKEAKKSDSADEKKEDAKKDDEKKDESVDYKGVKVSKFGEDEQTVYLAQVDKVALISNKESEIKALIDRSKEKASDSLDSSENYKKVSKQLEADGGQVFIYADTAAAKAFADENSANFPPQVKKLMESLQYTDFGGASLKFTATEILANNASPLNDSDLAKYLKSNPGDKPLASAGFASADNLLTFAVGLVDTEAIAKLVKEFGAGAGDDAAKQLEAMEGQLGFKVEGDLVPAIGKEFAIIVNKVGPGKGMLPVDVEAGILIQVKDEAKINKVLGALEKLGAAALASPSADADSKKEPATEFATKTIGSVKAKIIPAPIPGVEPLYAVTNGFLIIATSPDALKGLLDAKAGKGLVASDGFKKLAPKITDSAQSLVYVNLNKLGDVVKAFAAAKGDDSNPAMAIAEKVFSTLGVAAGISKVKDDFIVSTSVITSK